ncbi:MAG: peptidylprolyl isomerase [Bacilli bacterium]|nr:peptidylprolyl isomerase [Bacilli bacterium]
MKIKIILNNNFKNGNEIIIDLYKDIAPITVDNFINLIKRKYFDGVIFHRIIKDFMIQTGGYYIEDNTIKEKERLNPIKGEFKSNGVLNNLHHELGVISMARTSIKDSATSQFFLCVDNCSHLDGEYAGFGMADDKSKKLIKEICDVETGYLSPMFSDFPYEVISIKTIEIIEE